MAQPKSDQDYMWDPTAHATKVLDKVLQSETDEILQEEKQEAAVKAELRRQRILEAESRRTKSRVLFVTNKTGVLEEGTLERKQFIDLQEVFDEVHVLVVGLKGKKDRATKRLDARAWAYRTTSYFSFQLTTDAVAVVEEELCFTDGFRPDLIVALEPYEAAVVAAAIAKRYKRSFQVHVLDDLWQNPTKFKAADKNNSDRLRFMQKALPQASSVLVSSESIKKQLSTRFKKISNIGVLPRYFHTRELLSVTNKTEAKKFPQFVFTIMYVGKLGSESTLYRALDASRVILQTPTIGLVVIGDGARLGQFRERTSILGISKQVIFLGAVPDPKTHIQAADVLLVTDTDAESDELIITAAALGVPLIMSRTPLREELFRDGYDAFLCDPEETFCFTTKLRTFLNTNALRQQFKTNGRSIIETRIEEDPVLYRIAYRDAIEAVLVKEIDAKEAAIKAEEAKKNQPIVMDGMEMKVPKEMEVENVI